MSYALELSKKRIISLIQKELDRYKIEHELDLELPPDEKMGDFAFPCFSLAPIFKKSPEIIAQNIVENIGSSDLIEKIEAKGGYVNFFLDKKFLSKSTLDSILNKKEKYGHLEKKSKKVIIEHTSANPNGPLHVGRARNPIIKLFLQVRNTVWR